MKGVCSYCYLLFNTINNPPLTYLFFCDFCSNIYMEKNVLLPNRHCSECDFIAHYSLRPCMILHKITPIVSCMQRLALHHLKCFLRRGFRFGNIFIKICRENNACFDLLKTEVQKERTHLLDVYILIQVQGEIRYCVSDIQIFIIDMHGTMVTLEDTGDDKVTWLIFLNGYLHQMIKD